MYLRTIFLSNRKCLLEVIKRRSEVHEKIYHVRALFILTNKHFPKTISQQEFGYVLPTELGRSRSRLFAEFIET